MRGSRLGRTALAGLAAAGAIALLTASAPPGASCDPPDYATPGPGLSGYGYGITTIQGVSRLIWANLSPVGP